MKGNAALHIFPGSTCTRIDWLSPTQTSEIIGLDHIVHMRYDEVHAPLLELRGLIMRRNEGSLRATSCFLCCNRMGVFLNCS
jgi:hypothetical protein